ncbi:MAG: helix-turn-helix transcriptional regulator [Bacteroidetes bacterium]|nr:helix-turn-helix transcriptional regulator [Bacteroidota bacterium]
MDKQLEKFLKDFGTKVKEQRELKKFTLEDMEFHTGIDASDFNKIEQGKTNITFRTFLKVCKGLNLQPKALFDFKIDLQNE